MNMNNLVTSMKQQLSNTTIDKKKSILGTLLVSAIAMGVSGTAMAHDGDDDRHDDDRTRIVSSVQYSGPVETATIQQVIAADSWFGEDDFTLEGKVVKQLTHSTYLFSDGTDEMTIKLKAKGDLNFSDTDTVRISGEYDSDMFEDPEFKVKKLTVL